MNYQDYTKYSKRTDTDYIEVATRLKELPVEELANLCKFMHLAIGVAGEAGELLDTFKKTLFYNQPIDTTNVEEEVGDIFWYLFCGIDNMGLDAGEIMQTNIAKLQKRYPEKFDFKSAMERKDT